MLSDLEMLPGQQVNVSPTLQQLHNQAQTECNRSIKFAVVQPDADFVGRIEWRDTDILIEIRDALDNQTAEYIAAHELCHALQMARGCPIVGGRVNEPEAVTLAICITDFIFDSLADTMAIKFGFPMALGFENWLKSTEILEVLKRPKNGRRYGDNWTKMWEKLEAARICRPLGLKPPRLPREFWTLYIAFVLANIIQRASNFGLTMGIEIQETIKRLPLLSRVANDLLNIGTLKDICDIEGSVSKFIRIFNYIKVVPGHIFMYKPLTDEIYIKGRWQPRPKGENGTTQWLKDLISKAFQKTDFDSPWNELK